VIVVVECFVWFVYSRVSVELRSVTLLEKPREK
jgi:hypothetical protein